METSAPSAQSGRVSPSPPFQTKTKGSALVGFSCGSAGEEFTCNVGDLGSIPGLGRPPGEGNSYPLQYSCLENSMTEKPSRLHTVYGVAELNTTECLTFPFHTCQRL